MKLQNPQQIAASLGTEVLRVVRAIKKNQIPAQKEGPRAGLYDPEVVRSALQLDAQREVDRLDALKHDS